MQDLLFIRKSIINTLKIKKFEAGSETTFDFKGLILVTTSWLKVQFLQDTMLWKISSLLFQEQSTPQELWQTWQQTSANATFETDVNTGIITLKVVNKQGALLPNTGGIGTTILYLVGTSLVLGAGVLFVVKKTCFNKIKGELEEVMNV